MSFEIKILCFNQDDPKKCTAKRMERFELSVNYNSFQRLPSRGIVLDPFASSILSPDDSILGEVGGILGVDCSWKIAEKTFSRLKLLGFEPRKLPDVVPANPVNSGKLGKLTTAEAIASALMICNQSEQAQKIMSIFKWGPAFLKLNEGHWKS